MGIARRCLPVLAVLAVAGVSAVPLAASQPVRTASPATTPADIGPAPMLEPARLPVRGGPVATSSVDTALRAAAVERDGARVVRRAKPFSMVGVRWAGPAPDRVLVRSKSTSGRWSGWTELDRADALPERGMASRSTEPVWTGPSRQLRVLAERSGRPVAGGLRVITIDPGWSPRDAQLSGTAARAAVPDRPVLVSRAQWGANENLMNWKPEYSHTTKAVVIHHTAGSNGYRCRRSAGVVRAIYRYHAVTNGWGDIGYNALVDKCGTIFEGRAGGLAMPTVGGHTGGFNESTFGISLLGNFSTVAPPRRTLQAVAKLTAWKLASGYRAPLGHARLVSTGGGTSKYPAGRKVTVKAIFPHRRVGATSCPGDAGMRKLRWLRGRVVELADGWRRSPIYRKWQALGGEDGWPDSVYRQEVELPGGGRGTVFRGSVNGGGRTTVTSHPRAGTHYISGSLRAKWLRLGGTEFGYPAADQRPIDDAPGAVVELSTGAAIYWSSATGAHLVSDPVKQWWLSEGGAAGRAGFPVSDEFDYSAQRADGKRQQNFQGAVVVYDPATGELDVRWT